MLQAVWMTDLHYAVAGEVAGIDVRARLATAVAHINTHYAGAAFCVITGDMVQFETLADYRALKAQLAALDIPYLPMVGNHDDRAMMKAHLDVPDNGMANFVQYSVTTDHGLFLCLDTQKAGSAAGEFCSVRMAWLRDALDGAGDVPVFIFMHHPPMDLDLPRQDEVQLEESAAFLDLISAYPNVRHLFMGHVHRATAGSIRGIPYTTMRAVSFQIPAPKPDWDWDGFEPVSEPANLGVITIRKDAVNLQYIQF